MSLNWITTIRALGLTGSLLFSGTAMAGIPTDQIRATKEFIRWFTELLKNSYVNSIESYRGEKVIFKRESTDGGYAEVDTVVVTNNGEEFTIDYRLSLAGRDWKVYDVVIENISLVNNYRSQFRRILGRSSFAELLRLMRDKSN